MRKSELATQLRRPEHHQHLSKIVMLRMIGSLTDDEIIDHHNSCTCCGGPILNDNDLSNAIDDAQNASDFFDIMDEYREEY